MRTSMPGGAYGRNAWIPSERITSSRSRQLRLPAVGASRQPELAGAARGNALAGDPGVAAVRAAGHRGPDVARPAALPTPRQSSDLAPLRRVQPVLRMGARTVDGLHVRGL